MSREGGHLEGGEDGVGLADDAYDDGTLLDCFLGIFDLEDAALRGAGVGSISRREEERERQRGAGSYKVTESLS